MNISIDPIKVKVDSYYLYDGLKNIGTIDGVIIGASAYKDYPLTFHILLEGSYLYSDLPLSALLHNDFLDKHLSKKSINGKICPKNEIENFQLDLFINKTVSCFFPIENIWIKGEYLTSFDFFTDNLSFHLIKLNNGIFSLVENHKINFNGDNILTDYKKSHLNHKL